MYPSMYFYNTIIFIFTHKASVSNDYAAYDESRNLPETLLHDHSTLYDILKERKMMFQQIYKAEEALSRVKFYIKILDTDLNRITDVEISSFDSKDCEICVDYSEITKLGLTQNDINSTNLKKGKIIILKTLRPFLEYFKKNIGEILKPLPKKSIYLKNTVTEYHPSGVLDRSSKEFLKQILSTKIKYRNISYNTINIPPLFVNINFTVQKNRDKYIFYKNYEFKQPMKICKVEAEQFLYGVERICSIYKNHLEKFYGNLEGYVEALRDFEQRKLILHIDFQNEIYKGIRRLNPEFAVPHNNDTYNGLSNIKNRAEDTNYMNNMYEYILLSHMFQENKIIIEEIVKKIESFTQKSFSYKYKQNDTTFYNSINTQKIDFANYTFDTATFYNFLNWLGVKIENIETEIQRNIKCWKESNAVIWKKLTNIQEESLKLEQELHENFTDKLKTNNNDKSEKFEGQFTKLVKELLNLMSEKQILDAKLYFNTSFYGIYNPILETIYNKMSYEESDKAGAKELYILSKKTFKNKIIALLDLFKKIQRSRGSCCEIAFDIKNGSCFSFIAVESIKQLLDWKIAFISTEQNRKKL